jgi:hypothetical protein
VHSRDQAARPRDAMALRERLHDIQTRRNRKWLRPRLAQLDFKDQAVRGLVSPPLDRDSEALERALWAEIAPGTHLVRGTDPGTGQPMPDTLDLVGERHRLRLVVLPDQPTFVVSRVYEESEAALEAMRRRGWPVAEEITWTSRRQPPAAARQAMEMVLAALDEHHLRLKDEQRQRDENRMFDKWMALLTATVANLPESTVITDAEIHAMIDSLGDIDQALAAESAQPSLRGTSSGSSLQPPEEHRRSDVFSACG